MAGLRVTVFGGSGYLGRRIVDRLASDGNMVRVAVRHPDRFQHGGTLVALPADVRDDASVAAAVGETDAVVNAVGLYLESGRETFDAVHVRGAARVAHAAARAGVGRLVHISGIGVDPRSESPYVRARAHGEEAVRNAYPDVTLLRPSALFGPGDAFLSLFDGLSRISPVIPLFGTGATKVQPVYVGDVADAVAAALADPGSKGKTYELGGPSAYAYKALIELVLRQAGRRRLLMPVPFLVWRGLARLLSPLPRPPLTIDQIVLIEQDNVVAARALTLADLGIDAIDLERMLPEVLGPTPTRR